IEIKNLLHERGVDIPVIAKIENAEGVKNLEEIVSVADGTMVARGDLGVELPLPQVPLIQKKIIRTTVTNGKPVITATQMLDSMTHAPIPTRAEVSDVANAILDGTSAVMLSGETAKGNYPVEAVRTMAALALAAEEKLSEYGHLQHILPQVANVVTEAVSHAAIALAGHINAAAVITLTESGFTARSMSKYRPTCPILAVTVSPDVLRKLAMNWGITAILFEGERSDEAMVQFAIRHGRGIGCINPNDHVVVTAGISQTTGSTSTIQVLTVED
ncbi:MAG TPA: pyruvate kinase, partial [Myxococcota bacterium]